MNHFSNIFHQFVQNATNIYLSRGGKWIPEDNFPAGAAPSQFGRARRFPDELPRALEEQRAEVVGGVHAHDVEAQFDDVRRGNDDEGQTPADVFRAEAVSWNRRNVRPQHVEEADRSGAVSIALQSVCVRTQACTAAPFLHDQLRQRNFNFFVLFRFESVDTTRKEKQV